MRRLGANIAARARIVEPHAGGDRLGRAQRSLASRLRRRRLRAPVLSTTVTGRSASFGRIGPRTRAIDQRAEGDAGDRHPGACADQRHSEGKVYRAAVRLCPPGVAARLRSRAARRAGALVQWRAARGSARSCSPNPSDGLLLSSVRLRVGRRARCCCVRRAAALGPGAARGRLRRVLRPARARSLPRSLGAAERGATGILAVARHRTSSPAERARRARSSRGWAALGDIGEPVR